MTLLGNIIKKAIELKDKLSVDDDPVQMQERTLRKLLEKAKDTQFGRRYGFEEILNSQDIYRSFAEKVPVYNYQKMYDEWWKAVEQGEPDVSWPGRPNYLALSSGTTNGASKKIPVTDDMLQASRQSSLHQITCLANYNLPAEFFEKEIMMLTSSTNINEEGIYPEGEISGISASNIPFWFKNYCRPGEEILSIDDWDERIDRIVQKAPEWDIGALSGIPSWIEMMLKKIISYYNLSNIHDIWPNLRVYATGGVAFGPYKKSFEKLLAHPLVYIDTYFCSEGFLAFQARPETEAMMLALENGIFFEFVPFETNNLEDDGSVKPYAPVLSLAETVEGKEYILLISTVSGAWRYMLGDTVRMVNKQNNEIVITGRTKHFLNVVGSKLTVDTMNIAIQKLSAEFGVTITEFTVAAVEEESGYLHKWYLGSDDLTDIAAATKFLDETFRSMNRNYKHARERALKDVKIEVVSPEVFYDWSEVKKKKGGQMKTPRVMEQEQFADWEKFVVSRKRKVSAA